MILRNKFLLCLLMLYSFQLAHAQDDPKKLEQPKKDQQVEMYRNIEKYSKKRKFTKFLHKLIFEQMPSEIKPPIKRAKKVVAVPKPTLAPYECKIIRSINITTLDPFGFSEKDTITRDVGWVFRAGNAVHNKTRDLAIKNLLLIRKNIYLDTLKLIESERLIRSQRYIRAVVITPKEISPTSDSIDINIRVLDSWSLIPDFAQSGNTSTFKLREKNFLGLGHEFTNVYRKNLRGKRDAFSSSYTVPNIMNTYIRTSLVYDIDIDGNYTKAFDIERPFYSAYTRWAGGVLANQQYNNAVGVDTTQTARQIHYKYDAQDYWAGLAVPILKGNTPENRGTNLIFSARYFNKNYLEIPELVFDSLRVNSDEHLYLASVGLSARKYTKDINVLNFNIIEDIGSGLYGGFIGGYQQKNGQGRQYYGVRVAYGRYFKLGYASTNIEYGSFYNKGIPEQSAFSFSAIYFTRLLGEGRWKVRQFVKPQFVLGENRLHTRADELTLDGDSGIQGFSGTGLFGTKKLLVTLQTQGYSPWNVYGFRLNPYFNYTMGMLGNAAEGFNNSKLYSQVGFGVIVSNDYLVFSTFQFSFSFYPTIPGNGDSVIKTNSFKTYDIGLQSFEISRPSVAPYQ